MEPITVQEKILTSTIPGQVVGALQNYAQSVSAVRGILLAHGKWAVVLPINTVGVTVFKQQEATVASQRSLARGGIFVTPRGELVGHIVRPVTHDLRLEATGLLIKEFDVLASKLAIEAATARENRETTRAIGPTVLNRVSVMGGTAKVAQSTQVACRSTARSLLKFATGWAGDDLPALMKEVRKTRSKSSF